MKVQPFRALRPRADLAARIASLPYDVLSSDEARTLAAADPYSFLHVIKPEIDLAPDVPPDDESVYAKGRDNLRGMVERGWLVRDERPAYYVYRQTMGDHVQTGILGAAAIQDYLQDRIKKHEHTRPKKEDDRVRLNHALGANPGPVFLTYAARPELDATVEQLAAAEPEVGFTADDGVRHELWTVDAPRSCERIAALLAAVPASYVADGHHRTAAAARVGQERLKTIAAPTGREPANFFLAAHFPSNQLRVLDYNRVIRDLNGMTPQQLLERVSAKFDVQADFAAKRPQRAGEFGMYLAGSWYRLRAPRSAPAPEDPVRCLDVSILSEQLLQPLLAIGDPRTDARIDFVGGIRGMEELERRVDSGRDAVAFSLYPTSLDDVMRVADAGRVMPPKSTWFEPKLRSGLVVQLLDGDTL